MKIFIQESLKKRCIHTGYKYPLNGEKHIETYRSGYTVQDTIRMLPDGFRTSDAGQQMPEDIASTE